MSQRRYRETEGQDSEIVEIHFNSEGLGKSEISWVGKAR